ncbi:MAG: glycosyltransferase family 4 protein, partial [Anaerolineales bacterium]
STIIRNAVDLDAYTPRGPHDRPTGHYRLLLVEGSLGGGYEMGLETAIQLAQNLITNYQLPNDALIAGDPGRLELMIVGKVSPEIQTHWNERAKIPLRWAGLVPRERIPEIDRSAHLLYSADLNAACPNSVIEALACGLPVLAFGTGALPELVTPEAGQIVPYGGNPWQLDPPDITALAAGAVEIIRAGEMMRQAARGRAEDKFGLDEMVEKYLGVLAV